MVTEKECDRFKVKCYCLFSAIPFGTSHDSPNDIHMQVPMPMCELHGAYEHIVVVVGVLRLFSAGTRAHASVQRSSGTNAVQCLSPTGL